MRELNTKFSLSHINLSKRVKLLTFALFCSFLSFPSHRCTRSFSLTLSKSITLSRPPLTPQLTIVNCKHILLSLCFCSMEQFAISSTSRCSSPFLLLYYTRLSLIFQTIFFSKSWKAILFTMPFHLSLYSPRQSQDCYLSGIDQASLFSFHTHFALIHCHFSFNLTCKCLGIRLVVIILFTFLGTVNQLYFTL